MIIDEANDEQIKEIERAAKTLSTALNISYAEAYNELSKVVNSFDLISGE